MNRGKKVQRNETDGKRGSANNILKTSVASSQETILLKPIIQNTNWEENYEQN